MSEIAQLRRVIEAECNEKYRLVAESLDLRGRIEAIRNDTIEECARVADGRKDCDSDCCEQCLTAADIASKIRALKEKP